MIKIKDISVATTHRVYFEKEVLGRDENRKCLSCHHPDIVESTPVETPPPYKKPPHRANSGGDCEGRQFESSPSVAGEAGWLGAAS